MSHKIKLLFIVLGVGVSNSLLVVANDVNNEEIPLLSAHRDGNNSTDNNFSYADLSQRDLSTVNFQGCNLEGADLSRSNLESCNFRDANLKKANLWSANIENADFTNAEIDYETNFATQLSSAIGLTQLKHPKCPFYLSVMPAGSRDPIDRSLILNEYQLRQCLHGNTRICQSDPNDMAYISVKEIRAGLAYVWATLTGWVKDANHLIENQPWSGSLSFLNPEPTAQIRSEVE